MAFRFNDQHALALVTPHLYPGEQILYRGRGVEKPWWTTVFLRLGALFWRYFLVVATNHRLLLIRHRGLLGGYGEKGFEALPWNQLDRAELRWGIFNKPLVISASTKRWSKKISMNRFWMKGNFAAGEGIVQTWQQNRAALPPHVHAA